MTEPMLADVLREVETLHREIKREGQEISGRWRDWIGRENFAASAQNFAHYLALRRRDIRPLQRRLMQFGLSSLGRSESRVLPTLDALLSILRAAVGGATFTRVA
jgi:pyruvate kinase